MIQHDDDMIPHIMIRSIDDTSKHANHASQRYYINYWLHQERPWWLVPHLQLICSHRIWRHHALHFLKNRCSRCSPNGSVQDSARMEDKGFQIFISSYFVWGKMWLQTLDIFGYLWILDHVHAMLSIGAAMCSLTISCHGIHHWFQPGLPTGSQWESGHQSWP